MEYALDESLGVYALVMNCNKLAVDNLHLQNYQQALTLLQKAQNLLSSYPHSFQLKAITNNNLACLFYRMQDPSKALHYLQSTLNLEHNLNDFSEIAGTHLNLCVILSDLKKHQEALQNGLKSLSILKTHFQPSENHVTSLVVAYHNVGLQYEAIGSYEEALKNYQLGVELSLEQLGRTHNLTQTIAHTHKLALENIQTRKPVRKIKRTAKLEPLNLNLKQSSSTTRKSSVVPNPKSRDTSLTDKTKSLHSKNNLTSYKQKPQIQSNIPSVSESPGNTSQRTSQVSHNEESFTTPNLPPLDFNKQFKSIEDKIQNLQTKINEFDNFRAPLDFLDTQQDNKLIKKMQKKRAVRIIENTYKRWVFKQEISASKIYNSINRFLCRQRRKRQINRINNSVLTIQRGFRASLALFFVKFSLSRNVFTQTMKSVINDSIESSVQVSSEIQASFTQTQFQISIERSDPVHIPSKPKKVINLISKDIQTTNQIEYKSTETQTSIQTSSVSVQQSPHTQEISSQYEKCSEEVSLQVFPSSEDISFQVSLADFPNKPVSHQMLQTENNLKDFSQSYTTPSQTFAVQSFVPGTDASDQVGPIVMSMHSQTPIRSVQNFEQNFSPRKRDKAV